MQERGRDQKGQWGRVGGGGCGGNEGNETVAWTMFPFPLELGGLPCEWGDGGGRFDCPLCPKRLGLYKA